MSATPQGPGWWQASDGNWYPPTAHASPSDQTPWWRSWGAIILWVSLVLVGAVASYRVANPWQFVTSAVADSERATTTDPPTTTSYVPPTTVYVPPTTIYVPPTTVYVPPSTVAPVAVPATAMEQEFKHRWDALPVAQRVNACAAVSNEGAAAVASRMDAAAPGTVRVGFIVAVLNEKCSDSSARTPAVPSATTPPVTLEIDWGSSDVSLCETMNACATTSPPPVTSQSGTSNRDLCTIMGACADTGR